MRDGETSAILTNRGTKLVGSALQKPVEVVETAIGLHPETCNGLLASSTFATGLIETVAPTLSLSFAELNDSSQNPNPDSELCVPCQLHPRRRRGKGGTEVELDLAASVEIASGVSLLEMTLELGGKNYRFSPAHEEFIMNALELATLDRLTFDVDWDVDQPGTLYYRLKAPTGEVYWDSTPMTLHQDSFDRYLFADPFESGNTSLWTQTNQ